MPDDWFPGKGRDAEDEAFLSELRRCAVARGLADARPEDTALHTWESALVVLVDVPGLQEGSVQPTLEVVCDPRRSSDLMAGWETHGSLADSCDPLDLTGVERTPRSLGRHAFDWFHAELRRPVLQIEWPSGAQARRVEWRLQEPDELLALTRSGWWSRRRRDDPGRVTRLR